MKKLIPIGGNDRVYTPLELARMVVNDFRPSGRVLEPCYGDGAFYAALKGVVDYVDFMEIDKGLCFLTMNPPREKYDWIVTNPPFSKFRAFLNRSMELADNVVFLCTINHFFLKARIRDMREAGFEIMKIVYYETPPKPWPQSGFQVGGVHIGKAIK